MGTGRIWSAPPFRDIPLFEKPDPLWYPASPEPDYEIIAELKKADVKHIVAEGRITNGEKMKKRWMLVPIVL